MTNCSLFSDGDGTEGQRYRRDVINGSYYDYLNGERESELAPYDAHNITFYENKTFDNNNMTELISTTVSTFLENITVSFDPYNTTFVSEQWTDFISTISTQIDSSDSDSETYADTDTDIDAYDFDDECIDNPNGSYNKTICYEVTDNDSTTPSMTNESPMEMRVPASTVSTTFNSGAISFMNAPMATAADESLSPNLTSSANSTNKIRAQACVPFVPNRGDNITGIPPEYVGQQLSKTIQKMNQENQQKLRDLCWETLFGQELVKLTVLDLIFTIFATLFMDFFRALFVRFMNKCWCWDLEKRFPKVLSISFHLFIFKQMIFSLPFAVWRF